MNWISENSSTIALAISCFTIGLNIGMMMGRNP